MISKELLSEVLKDKLKEEYNGSYDFICNGVVNLERNEVSSTLGFYDSELDFFINIYELAYKCKEWALRKNYILASESNTYGGICNMSISSMDVDVFYNIQSTTRANTEVEAVIKACEWILNNKDRK